MHSNALKTDKDSPFVITNYSIQNENLRITFDEKSAEICSILNIKSNRELLSSPTNIALMNDENNDTWAHNTVCFKNEVKTNVKASISIIEQGPVRATVRIVQSFENSTLIRDYLKAERLPKTYRTLADSESVAVNHDALSSRHKEKKWLILLCAQG